MIALVEGAERQKTPNEIALNILIAGLTLIFLLAVVTLQPYCGLQRCAGGFGNGSDRRGAGFVAGVSDPDHDRRICSPPSASPAWIASCSTTCWR